MKTEIYDPSDIGPEVLATYLKLKALEKKEFEQFKKSCSNHITFWRNVEQCTHMCNESGKCIVESCPGWNHSEVKK